MNRADLERVERQELNSSKSTVGLRVIVEVTMSVGSVKLALSKAQELCESVLTEVGAVNAPVREIRKGDFICCALLDNACLRVALYLEGPGCILVVVRTVHDLRSFNRDDRSESDGCEE